MFVCGGAYKHCTPLGVLLFKHKKRKKRKNSAPGRTRTCNLLIRSQALYPIELRVRVNGE